MQKLIVVGLVSMALVGCGSDSGSSDSNTGKLNLAFSDAPVDGLEKVCVAFDQISVHHANGSESSWGTASFIADQSSEECIPDDMYISEDKKGYPEFMVINLMAYQGNEYLQVLNDKSLEAGKYAKIQLNAVAGGYYGDDAQTPFSHVVTSDGEVKELGYSNANGKLMIHNDFEVYGSKTGAYTLEFDLRQGIVFNKPHGYRLKPTAIRMVHNDSVAMIDGLVSKKACGKDISDAYIYVYTAPTDGNYAGIYEGDENAPYTTTAVDASTGEFEIGYVPLGHYDIALICNGSVDYPDQDNSADLDIDYDSIYQDIGLTSDNLTVTF